MPLQCPGCGVSFPDRDACPECGYELVSGRSRLIAVAILGIVGAIVIGLQIYRAGGDSRRLPLVHAATAR